MKIFNGYVENYKKQISQYATFQCGTTHSNYSLEKIGKTFNLQKELLQTEMNHDEIDYNNYKDKKGESLDYGKQDVLRTVFSYARYCKAIQEITEFSRKDCLSAPGLGWKFFECLRDKNDETFYTSNDKYMRYLVRQSIKRGRVCAFNQFCKSNLCGGTSKILSRELKVEGNVYDIFETYMNYKKII